jgi:hypothetical protein
MSTVVSNGELQPRARKKPSYLDLLDEPDQDRIYDDLAAFFGPNAEKFIEVYEKMRVSTGSRRAMPRIWSWPVFFGYFIWFFYRKMYGYGAMLIFLPVIMGYLVGYGGSSAMGIVFAMWAKGTYVNGALRRVYKADQLGLSGDERHGYLQRAGGISLIAGIFAGLIYAVLLAAAIFAGVHKAGH